MHEIRQPRQRGTHVAREADEGLVDDGRGPSAEVEFRDDEEVEEDVDSEAGRADQQRDVRVIERARAVRDGDLDGGGEGGHGGDAHVGEGGAAHLGGDEGGGDLGGGGDEDEGHEGAEEGLREDQGVGEAEARGDGPCGFVPDDEPSYAGEAFV